MSFGKFRASQSKLHGPGGMGLFCYWAVVLFWAHLFPSLGFICFHIFFQRLHEGVSFWIAKAMAVCIKHRLLAPSTVQSQHCQWCGLEGKENQPMLETNGEQWRAATGEVHDVKQKPVLFQPIKDLEVLLILPAQFQLFPTCVFPSAHSRAVCTPTHSTTSIFIASHCMVSACWHICLFKHGACGYSPLFSLSASWDSVWHTGPQLEFTAWMNRERREWIKERESPLGRGWGERSREHGKFWVGN